MRATSLHVVMYHYVRDLERTRYPKIKALLLDEFRRHVDELPRRYEMATLESALAFLSGAYEPERDLCLLTFDDGLKEHYAEVAPLLVDRGIQAAFFLITGCLERGSVAPVHMNHFLMAALDFDLYRREFIRGVAARDPAASARASEDGQVAAATYPWDTHEVAGFKYFFNFVLDPKVRDAVVRELFVRHIGPEEEFSAELYLSWEEARRMQSAGLVMGGHSHWHRPLATLSRAELHNDLASCRALLDIRLAPQKLWPFCFPYGKSDSFNAASLEELAALRFHCAFTTEAGANTSGAGPFEIRRLDCKHALRAPAMTVGR